MSDAPRSHPSRESADRTPPRPRLRRAHCPRSRPAHSHAGRAAVRQPQRLLPGQRQRGAHQVAVTGHRHSSGRLGERSRVAGAIVLGANPHRQLVRVDADDVEMQRLAGLDALGQARGDSVARPVRSCPDRSARTATARVQPAASPAPVQASARPAQRPCPSVRFSAATFIALNLPRPQTTTGSTTFRRPRYRPIGRSIQMERGLYIAASGMLAEQVRQDQIANDLANASTPGYKADRAAQASFNDMLLHNSSNGAAIGSHVAHHRHRRTAHRPQPGAAAPDRQPARPGPLGRRLLRRQHASGSSATPATVSSRPTSRAGWPPSPASRCWAPTASRSRCPIRPM